MTLQLLKTLTVLPKNVYAFDPHLILLDINLPSYDGYYWCRQLRIHTTCPIIFISARSGEMDQVFALENGGDDFITKPFHYEIVLAKIRSHLRRSFGEYALINQNGRVKLGALNLYIERMELHIQDEIVPLAEKRMCHLGITDWTHLQKLCRVKFYWKNYGMINHLLMKIH